MDDRLESAESQAPVTAPRQAGEADIEPDLDLNLVAESVAENRAVTRSRSRRAQQDARSVRARAETAQDAARRATDLAVSALAELDGLRRAMQSRSDIDLAKGILMERLRTDAGSAFDMLVKMSQRSRTKLVDVARAIVADVAASPVRDTD